MSKYLITRDRTPQFPTERGLTLDVMEFFCDTIQGEGPAFGIPAAFLRLQGCTLDCVWCDTEWRLGHTYSFNEIFELMESKEYDLVRKLKMGHSLILTGGSPLKQQYAILNFLKEFIKRHSFLPAIQIENECTLEPCPEIQNIVTVWNNSPKLSSSGMKRKARYKPGLIQLLAKLPRSNFKFVVGSEDDWKEIEEDFLTPGLINRVQIVLMPLADNLEQLHQNRNIALDLAIREGVRYSSREQITLNIP